jgi:hypothetical protein
MPPGPIFTMLSVTNRTRFAAETNHSVTPGTLPIPPSIPCTAATDRMANETKVSLLERCRVARHALRCVTFRLASLSDRCSGAPDGNRFGISTNLFAVKVTPSAAQSGSSVTPAIVCVTDTTFFAATFVIAAKNIAGAVPAILCFQPNQLFTKEKKACPLFELHKATDR